MMFAGKKLTFAMVSGRLREVAEKRVRDRYGAVAKWPQPGESLEAGVTHVIVDSAAKSRSTVLAFKAWLKSENIEADLKKAQVSTA